MNKYLFITIFFILTALLYSNEIELKLNKESKIDIKANNVYNKEGIKLKSHKDFLNALNPINDARTKYKKLIGYRVGAYIFLNTTIIGGSSLIAFFTLGLCSLFTTIPTPLILIGIFAPILVGPASVAPMIVFFAHSGKKSKQKIIKYYNEEIDKLNKTSCSFTVLSLKF